MEQDNSPQTTYQQVPESLVQQTPPPVPPGYGDKEPVTPATQEIKLKKDLYTTSYLGIFFRNFLAGFARGLGAIIAYLILFGISSYFFVTYALPEIQPLLSTFENIGQMASGNQDNQEMNVPINPDLLRQLIPNLPTQETAPLPEEIPN